MSTRGRIYSHFKRLLSLKTVNLIYYWLKVFAEGERLRDKLALLPGVALRIIGYALAFLRIPQLPRVFSLAARPPVNILIRNRDERFYCRKYSDDVMFATEFYELELRKYFEEIKEGVFVDI